jgi:hypothetical protein
MRNKLVSITLSYPRSRSVIIVKTWSRSSGFGRKLFSVTGIVWFHEYKRSALNLSSIMKNVIKTTVIMKHFFAEFRLSWRNKKHCQLIVYRWQPTRRTNEIRIQIVNKIQGRTITGNWIGMPNENQIQIINENHITSHHQYLLGVKRKRSLMTSLAWDLRIVSRQ